MDFYSLNRFVERVLHKGETSYPKSVYEKDVNSFVTQNEESLKKSDQGGVLNSSNSTHVGDIKLDDDKRNLVFVRSSDIKKNN